VARPTRLRFDGRSPDDDREFHGTRAVTDSRFIAAARPEEFEGTVGFGATVSAASFALETGLTSRGSPAASP
jgi:ADP-dependent phosphofructokinase/glucokinase